MFNRFYFRGFQPSSGLEDFTDAVLAEILCKAPGDASCLGSVERIPDGYQARLDIYSIHGPFLADAFSADPEKAVEGVAAEVLGQLTAWIEKRRAVPIRPPSFYEKGVDPLRA